MAARPAVDSGSVWEKVRGAWTGGRKVQQTTSEGEGDGGDGEGSRGEQGAAWDYGVDGKRGWIIGAAWLVACAVK